MDNRGNRGIGPAWHGLGARLGMAGLGLLALLAVGSLAAAEPSEAALSDAANGQAAQVEATPLDQGVGPVQGNGAGLVLEARPDLAREQPADLEYETDLGCATDQGTDLGEERVAESDSLAGPEQIRWVNTFGLRVLEALLAEESGPNTMISPLSLVTALTMTAQGAAGETAAAFAQALDYGDDPALAARTLAALGSRLVREGEAMTLRQANGLWLGQDLQLQADFAATQEDAFGARVQAVDFADPQVLEEINAWFAEQTANLIPRLLDRLDPETRIILGNALSMKGRWLTPFDPERTEDAPFFSSPEASRPVAMMHLGEIELAYREDDRGQSVLLPFADPDFELVVILPGLGIPLADFLTPPDPAATSPLLTRDGYRPLPGHLGLPRLDLHLGGDLTGLLTTMGLFAGQDFSRMADEPLVFDQVVHRIAFQVDETGAQAAAATAVAGVRSARPKTSFEMLVNRPFLTALRHTPSNLLLFLGVVGAP